MPVRPSTLKRQQVQGNPDSWRGDKRTAAQRGYGYKWQQARAGHLAKHPHCVMCLAGLGMTDLQPAEVIVECARRGVAEPLATVVNHKVAHRGNQALFWDSRNWESLCSHHHNSDAQRIDKRLPEKARIGLEGWPIKER